MLDKKEFIAVGYGGHALVVLDAMLELNFIPKYYSALTKSKINPFNLQYLGSELNSNFPGWKMNNPFVLCIGNNKRREKIGELIIKNNKEITSIIHPSSSLSKKSNIGKGVFVSKGVMVNAMAQIQDYVILNTACVIEHGCTIGKGSHIAPGVVIAGDVVIGKRSFIGANSIIKQGVSIGDDVIIGAGSVVLNDIKDSKVYFGNPAKESKI